MNKIPNRLKEIREKLGISVEQASKLIGVTSKTLKKWENKFTDFSAKYLIKISRVYNVTVNYIFFLDNKKRDN